MSKFDLIFHLDRAEEEIKQILKLENIKQSRKYFLAKKVKYHLKYIRVHASELRD